MRLRVSRSQLTGKVRIPGSKSHTIRAIAVASLANGRSEIHQPLVSSDARSAVDAYRALGAQIECNPDCWVIHGINGRPAVPDNIIDVGNSGTTLRLAVGTAALLSQGSAVFTGDKQIRSRPIGPLLKSLNDLGARAFSTRDNDKAPVVIQGPLTGGSTSIQAVTSQYLSSLLLTCPLAQGDTHIDVPLLNEVPYVEMTLKYLDDQGIRYQRQGMKQFDITGNQSYQPFSRPIPADWSSATFFLCAAAILGCELEILGLDINDTQGDKAIVSMLTRMGAKIDIDNDRLIIKGTDLHGTELDLNATPDALPAFAVTACFAEGQTRLVNVPQARLKETDRIAVMAHELKKMGAVIDELPDGLVINQSSLKPAHVSGNDDHRVVMALSLAAMACDGQTVIDTAEAMNVTFPEFVTLMNQLHADMTLDPA